MMILYKSQLTKMIVLSVLILASSPGYADNRASVTGLSDEIQSILDKPLYKHSTWGVYLKNLETGEELYKINSDKMFLPASTTKLFFASALLETYGFDYRFHTPVYAMGSFSGTTLQGNLVLVGKGDLTLGGRRMAGDKIAYTNFDHIDANAIPGTILTSQNPLQGLKNLARQIKVAGIHQVSGHVLIDDRYFEATVKRENTLSPIIINDNLIDFTVTPGEVGQSANVDWGPKIPQIQVINQVKTVSGDQADGLDIVANADGNIITLSGAIALDKTNIINTHTIDDPKTFVQHAFEVALGEEGIDIINSDSNKPRLPDAGVYAGLKPIAILESAPMSEYVKLILKVSHNLGANMVPLLLAAHDGQSNYSQGMLKAGQTFIRQFNLEADTFHFDDAAGGDGNRITPETTAALLTYWYKQPDKKFKQFVHALPILGVDGSLAIVAQSSAAKNHVFAKTGTGVSYNYTQDSLFLTTKALAGYIQSKDDHWYTFVVVVNNAPMESIQTVFAINEDVGQVAAELYKAID